jgi:hypothetical protein
MTFFSHSPYCLTWSPCHFSLSRIEDTAILTAEVIKVESQVVLKMAEVPRMVHIHGRGQLQG